MPFAARFPAETIDLCAPAVRTLMDFTNSELDSLAQIISVMRKKYDNLYGFLLPLMMAVKQAPLQQKELPYHFHIQFLPLAAQCDEAEVLGNHGNRIWRIPSGHRTGRNGRAFAELRTEDSLDRAKRDARFPHRACSCRA